MRLFQKIRIDVTDKDGNTARLFYFRVTLWLHKLTEKTYI
ncbi:hypothetical protein D024_3446 [Vibrio parahaemolyticus 3259]|nr:hypothetical protein D024_3446 [Vibrio parahaemolyticus 3259]EXJ36593.1 hypothetical protein D050_0703 [Vibrio parahaemolyticus VPCR-2009]EXJ48475.1 hypothetical protein D047_1388 [Vibrio parahaemolyticus VPTS-2010_2]